MAISDGDRLLKLAEVLKRVSLGKTAVYAKMDEGIFPNAVRLGPNCVRWRLSEINTWMGELQPRSSIKQDDS